MRFVSIEEAQAAAGLRMIIAGGFPSPWSQAAMTTFDLKQIDYLAVRFRPVAEQTRAWTGSHNVPVVIFNEEPPRTGWAEILMLAETMGGAVSLVPQDDWQRIRMFGLAHEILGEGGLCWSIRLLLTHSSFATEGREGWPLNVATYLAPKYGYAPDRVEPARQRAVQVLELLGRTLDESQAEGGGYCLGATLTALDLYSTAAMGLLAPLPHDVCPMLAPVRQALDSLAPHLRAAIPRSLLAHRDRMYERHLVLPVRF